MNKPLELLNTCRKLGLSLQRRGDRLAVRPASRATPELLAQLRENKSELLLLLEAEQYILPPDQLPWVHISKQVLSGEFEGASHSLRESLFIGLRSIPHPLCSQAAAQLQHRLESK